MGNRPFSPEWFRWNSVDSLIGILAYLNERFVAAIKHLKFDGHAELYQQISDYLEKYCLQTVIRLIAHEGGDNILGTGGWLEISSN